MTNSGAWGLVTTSDMDDLNGTVRKAISMARAVAQTRDEPIQLAGTKTYEDVVHSVAQKDPI